MLAMMLENPRAPLSAKQIPLPQPDAGEVLIRVSACGVCRTDLHIVDGELPDPKLPLVPGHEVVGVIEATGAQVAELKVGDRVGVPWLGRTCGHCYQCLNQHENLCENAMFTGYTRDGGYAEHTVADARYVFKIPGRFSDQEAAPLLCAGLIGWRSLAMTGDAERIGIYGFGAAGHLICQIAVGLGRRVYAFTRSGDSGGQAFARQLGATWAGAAEDAPLVPLDAAIIFAPVGDLVPLALKAVRPGGVVVCGGIYMTDIPRFPYELLWGERQLRSVANLTRDDGLNFFAAASRCPLRISTTQYALADANQALHDLKQGKLNGAAVLNIGSSG